MRVIELVFVRQLAVAPQELWPWISDPTHIEQWASLSITPLTPGEGGDPSAVGATRTVQMGPLQMTELVVRAEEPALFVYSITEGGFVRTHEATVSLSPTTQGTQLTWTVSLEPAIPGTGWLLRRSLTRQFARDLSALDAML